MKIILICLILFLTTSCISTVHLDSLTLPRNPDKSIYITEFKYKTSDGITGLVGGEYKAEYEDSSGVFYKGPERCVIIPYGRPYGGLYVPYSGNNKDYKIYYYVKTPSYVYEHKKANIKVKSNELSHKDAAAAGLISSAIINSIISSEGEIYLIPYTSKVVISSYVSNQK